MRWLLRSQRCASFPQGPTYKNGRCSYRHLIASRTMGRTSGYCSIRQRSSGTDQLTIQGVLVSAAPDASFLFGLNEWIQNLECVTPSCTHRANSSGSGKGPPNPPISEPWLIMPDKQAFSWIAWDPRRFFQLALSAKSVGEAAVDSPRGVVSSPCRRSVFEGTDIS